MITQKLSYKSCKSTTTELSSVLHYTGKNKQQLVISVSVFGNYQSDIFTFIQFAQQKKRCCYILLQQQRITSVDMKQIGIIAKKI